MTDRLEHKPASTQQNRQLSHYPVGLERLATLPASPRKAPVTPVSRMLWRSNPDADDVSWEPRTWRNSTQVTGHHIGSQASPSPSPSVSV